MSLHKKKEIPAKIFERVIWSRILNLYPKEKKYLWLLKDTNDPDSVPFYEGLALKIFKKPSSGKRQTGSGVIQNDIITPLNQGKDFLSLNTKSIEKLCNVVKVFYQSDPTIIEEVTSFQREVQEKYNYSSGGKRNYIHYHGRYRVFFIRSDNASKHFKQEERVKGDYTLSIDSSSILLYGGGKTYISKGAIGVKDFFHNNLNLRLEAKIKDEGENKEVEVITLLFKVPRSRNGNIRFLSGLYLALEEDDLRQPICGHILIVREGEYSDTELTALSQAYFRESASNTQPLRAMTNVKISRLFEGPFKSLDRYRALFGSWYIYFILPGYNEHLFLKSTMSITDGFRVEINFDEFDPYVGQVNYKKGSNYYQIISVQKETNSPFIVSFNFVLSSSFGLPSTEGQFILNNPYSLNTPYSGICILQKLSVTPPKGTELISRLEEGSSGLGDNMNEADKKIFQWLLSLESKKE